MKSAATKQWDWSVVIIWWEDTTRKCNNIICLSTDAEYSKCFEGKAIETYIRVHSGQNSGKIGIKDGYKAKALCAIMLSYTHTISFFIHYPNTQTEHC